jgi:sulfur carrier protein
MTVIVNGEPAEVAAGATVAELLARLGHPASGAGIAVALNGEVVPRTAWPATGLAERDRVEVLGAAQGG